MTRVSHSGKDQMEAFWSFPSRSWASSLGKDEGTLHRSADLGREGKGSRRHTLTQPLSQNTFVTSSDVTKGAIRRELAFLPDEVP